MESKKKIILNQFNILLAKFHNLKQYKSIKLPLRSFSDIKTIPIITKRNLKEFDFSLSPEPFFNVTGTSGSTEDMLLIIHSRKCYETHLKRLVKIYKSIGLKKGDICINTCSYSLNSGGRLMETALRQCGVAVIPFGSFDFEHRVSELVFLIQRLKPNIINAYTNQLYNIFIRLKRRHNIEKCIINGEPLFTSYKKMIETSFGTRLYNNYGSMEFSGIAISDTEDACEYMRIFEDGLFLEVLLSNGETKELGKGKIIITDLTNFSMPFIRYQLGDEGEIITIKGKKFIRIFSRSDDSILLNGIMCNKTKIIEEIENIIRHPNFYLVVNKDIVTYKDLVILYITKEDLKHKEAILEKIKQHLHNIKVVTKNLLYGVPKTSTGKLKHFIDMRKNV